VLLRLEKYRSGVSFVISSLYFGCVVSKVLVKTYVAAVVMEVKSGKSQGSRVALNADAHIYDAPILVRFSGILTDRTFRFPQHIP